MKKLLTSLLCLVVLFSFTGCGSFMKEKSSEEETITNTASTTEEKKADDKAEVEPSQVPYNVEVLPPDSIGCVYGKLTYTNNGEYPITRFQLKIQYTENGQEGETSYFSSYDTVLNGETCPYTTTFCSPDWKPLTLEYTIYDKEAGKTRTFMYDYKLDQLKGTNWTEEY